jgi:hypothetical protein
MGGEPIHDGAGVSRPATGPCAGTTVYHLGVLLGTSDPCTHNFGMSASKLRRHLVVGAVAARFVLGRAIIIVWMGTSSTSIVVHTLCPQSWLSPRPSHHRHLLGDADYGHGGARAMAPTSAPITPNYDGLTAATEAPPYARMGVQ